MNTKISEYLNKVVDISNDKISIEFGFSEFDRVNIYLLRSVLNKQKHLWLKPCDDNITKFYQSMLFAVAVDFFEKNYCENEPPIPRIGDKYQQGNKRFEVVDVDFKYEGVENPIKLKCINKNQDFILTTSITTLVNDYAKLDKRTGVTNRDTFKPMLDFIEKTLGERENIPPFPHKFAVVAQRNHFESCFSQLDKRAFPYIYIADSGEKTENLPVSSPMFFVVSSYEAIQEYIFDKDIRLDTIIFMGNKYDDQLQQDIDRGRFQQGIFIGEKKPDMQSLLQWQWTLPEYQYFDGLAQGQIEVVEVNNAILEEKITQFIQYIKKLETDNCIDLKRLYPYVSYIYPLVVLSDNSRLKNGIDVLSQSFQRKSEQVLGEAFNDIDSDYQEGNQQLVNHYQMILEQVYFENNAKTKALQQTKETDYLLMPEQQTLHVWQAEIKTLNGSNTEVISFSKFKRLEKQRSVTILSLVNYDFYRVIRNSRHHTKWLLYDEEYKRYKKFSKEYDNELIGEYRSSDRKKLVGIDYPDEIQSETVDEMMERILMERIFGAESDKNEYRTTYQDHIEKKITFTNYDNIELSANSVVILIDQHNKSIKYKVADLRVGDNIRTYKNQHKEVLFNAISESDTQGKFQQIFSDSKLWKDKLIRYCTDDEKIAGIANKCDVTIHTVNGWLSYNSTTKFPQNIEPLKDILGADYQRILDRKTNYNSFMIALGRDLSDEMSDYVLHKKKGKILEPLDDDLIKAISDRNMPIRTIKNIEII